MGILAHEFGHFAQGSGMRATYVIRSVNAWFARVVYERDAWDATLAAWGRDTDFRIAVVIHVIRFCVWLTRRLLWLLMLAGHAVSMFMLREMEYDADRYEVAIAGTESFVVSARAFPVLNLAHQGAIDTLSQSWTERRLGDDLPRLILAEHARIPDAARRELLDHHLKGKGSVFDTHPPDQRRIERAERTPSKGVFTIDLPAVELFRDFPGLSRRATSAFYREVLGKEFSEKNLVRAETMVAQESAARSDQDALARFFQDAVLPSAPLFVPDAAKTPAEDVEAAARELRECAGEVVSQAEFTLAASERELFEAQLLFDAGRTQGVEGPYHVDQVPAGVTVLPLPGIGVEQVAVEEVATHLVIEAQAVVAQGTGARLAHQRLDAAGELGLGQAAAAGLLGRDAGDQAGLGVGQEVIGRLAEPLHRRADLVELGIGAEGRELRGAIAARIGTEGLVVVPQEGQRGGMRRRHERGLSNGAGMKGNSLAQPRMPLSRRRGQARGRVTFSSSTEQLSSRSRLMLMASSSTWT